MWRRTCGQHSWQAYSLFHPFSDVLLIFDREGGHAESTLRGLAHWPQLIFDLANRAGARRVSASSCGISQHCEEPHGEGIVARWRAVSGQHSSLPGAKANSTILLP